MEPLTSTLVGGSFAVVIAGFLVKFLTDLIKNDLAHLTAAVSELTEEIRRGKQ